MSAKHERQIEVDTPQGPGRFHLAAADKPRALLIMGHGAGGGVDAVDLSALAARLPERGISVARFEQPWRVAGKKVASRPPVLDVAWNAALPAFLGAVDDHDVELYVGGRSAGARVACRTAPEHDQVLGVVCCAFPLHPPGRPEKSRADELLGAGVRRLVLQGERDAFGGPDQIRAVLPAGESVTLIPVPGADHSMRVAKSAPITPAQARDLIVDSVADFITNR